MATVDNKAEAFFTNLETRRSLLSSCTSLYQTLTSHVASLRNSISSKSQTLDTILQTLDSDYESSLHSVELREQSIPDRLSSLTSQVESLTQLALSEIQKPERERPLPVAEELKSLCIKMDEHKLLKYIMWKRKEASSVKGGIGPALALCVDPARLVLECVREYMELKANAKSGQPDRRWACGVMIGALFPFSELKESKRDVRALFPVAVLERAAEMAKEWKEQAQERVAAGLATGSGEGLFGMGPCEGAMFLQFVVGFGLIDKFEYEFLKSLVLEFTTRKDIAKLARPLFGEKLEVVISELIQNGKDVDAVYFVKEADLTEKFNPVTLLNSALSKAKETGKDTLKKDDNGSVAAEEARAIEVSNLKYIIKCVEENKLEEEFPLTTAQKRLSSLEKVKNEKKKGGSGGGGGGSRSSISHKRSHSSSGPPPPRPTKVSKFSSPYVPSYGQRNPVSPAQQNPVSRYPGPYSYPSQTTYDTGVTASSYGSTYGGGSHLPGSAQVASQPPPYAVQHIENVAGPAPQAGSYGGAQLSYGSYDYTAGALNTYPPAYTQ